MLDRKHRFSFKRGVPKKTVAFPLFVVRFEEKEEKGLECAVVVGKKVHKHAVQRNKIKRKIISIIKELFELTTPYRIVIYARKPIATSDEMTIRNQMNEALKVMKTL